MGVEVGIRTSMASQLVVVLIDSMHAQSRSASTPDRGPAAAKGAVRFEKKRSDSCALRARCVSISIINVHFYSSAYF